MILAILNTVTNKLEPWGDGRLKREAKNPKDLHPEYMRECIGRGDNMVMVNYETGRWYFKGQVQFWEEIKKKKKND